MRSRHVDEGGARPNTGGHRHRRARGASAGHRHQRDGTIEFLEGPRTADDHDWDIEHTHPETRGSPLMLLSLILLSVALAAIAQIVLKHGMNQVVDRTGEAFRFELASLRAVALTPAVWAGLALFAMSALVWLGVLSRAALSFAYPFAALTYVVIVAYDTFRGEYVTALRWGGVALIVAGIVLVSRTGAGGASGS